MFIFKNYPNCGALIWKGHLFGRECLFHHLVTACVLREGGFDLPILLARECYYFFVLINIALLSYRIMMVCHLIALLLLRKKMFQRKLWHCRKEWASFNKRLLHKRFVKNCLLSEYSEKYLWMTSTLYLMSPVNSSCRLKGHWA